MNNKKKLPLSQKVQHSLLAIVASLAVCLLFLLLFATGGRGEALKSFFILPLTTANGWSEMINAATTFTFIATVSYTHLDVYKRQDCSSGMVFAAKLSVFRNRH